MSAQPQLPSITNATQPATYTLAKRALAECGKIDECKGWADKAAALGSYAKQSKDESLFKLATRIQARAIRRCGELLLEFEPARNQHGAREGDRPSRKQVAEEGGLSDWQQKTATRVASVSEEEFESQVESDSPPTVTALAEQGTRKKPLHDLEGVEPRAFKLATEALGFVDRFSQFVLVSAPTDVWQGLKEPEKSAFFINPLLIDEWIALIKLTVNSVSNDIPPPRRGRSSSRQAPA
jgi:hypothetical protein